MFPLIKIKKILKKSIHINNCECLVFLRLAPIHQGYLATSYRIQSLMKTYDTLVVSNREDAYKNLNIETNRLICLPDLNYKIWSLFKYYICMASIIRSINPSIVILMNPIYSPLSMVFRKPKIIIWWNIHPNQVFPIKNSSQSLIKNLKNKVMLNLCYRGAKFADAVMPVGEHLHEELLANGCSKEKNHLVYLGVNSNFKKVAQFKQTRNDSIDINININHRRSINIIYTGSLKKERGLDLMVDAFERINRDGTKANLKIVGVEGKEYDYCNIQITNRNMGEYFTVHKKVHGSQIPQLLQNADAGLSLLENTPYYQYNPVTKVFEYLVAGLPVIANNIRTHSLYIKHWHNGLLFDYSSKALADSILFLWERQNEIARLSKNASSGSEKYLWEKIEPSFINVIKD